MVERGIDYEKAFTFAVERGFDFVELNMNHAFERQRIDPEAVRNAANEHDLPLLVHLPSRVDTGSPHEYVRDGGCRELEAAIDTAAELGAEKAIFHGTSQVSPKKWDKNEIRSYLYDSVRRLDTYARERDLIACVENMRTEFFDASDFPDLFTQTDGVACLDTGHAHVTGQNLATQGDLLREHGDRISHIHLNDTRLDHTDEHLPVGLGKLDFTSLTKAIRETEWTGTCTHEITLFSLEYAGHGKDVFDRLLAG